MPGFPPPYDEFLTHSCPDTTTAKGKTQSIRERLETAVAKRDKEHDNTIHAKDRF